MGSVVDSRFWTLSVLAHSRLSLASRSSQTQELRGRRHVANAALRASLLAARLCSGGSQLYVQRLAFSHAARARSTHAPLLWLHPQPPAHPPRVRSATRRLVRRGIDHATNGSPRGSEWLQGSNRGEEEQPLLSLEPGTAESGAKKGRWRHPFRLATGYEKNVVFARFPASPACHTARGRARPSCRSRPPTGSPRTRPTGSP